MKRQPHVNLHAHIPVSLRVDSISILAYCGTVIGKNEWSFISADHAKLSVSKGERVIPCDRCWKNLRELEGK